MKSVKVCDNALNYFEMAFTLYSNFSAIQEMPTGVCDEVTAIFSHKAFYHWLTGEGMDAIKVKSDSNMKDYIFYLLNFFDTTT